MFGKSVTQYLSFQKVFLVLIVVVGLLRLGLSLLGLPNSTVRLLSMNVVMWAGVLYYGVAVHTRGFGSYQQLLPLGLFQTLVFQAIACLGIVLTLAGHPNIYSAPEFSMRAPSQGAHLLAHLTIGLVIPPLLFWAVASLVLLVTKKLAVRAATA